jgi:hypothetical protein
MSWLYKMSELVNTEFDKRTVSLFNDAWEGLLKTDPLF